MNLLKLLGKLAVLACVGIAALTIAGKVSQHSGAKGGGVAAGPSAADDKLSDAGFFLLSRDDAKNPNVIIMSPPNCPSYEAQRARELADGLRDAGIPSELKQGIEFQFHDPDDVARVNKHMNNLPNPLVLVRGWAKGSPTLQDVIAQYRDGR
jgi:hypothetical protein